MTADKTDQYRFDDARFAALCHAVDDAIANEDDLYPALVAYAAISEFELNLEDGYEDHGRGRIIALSYKIAGLCFKDDETRFTLYDYLEAAVNNTLDVTVESLLETDDADAFVRTLRDAAQYKRDLYA